MSKKAIFFPLILLVTLLVASCSLDRKNPLDPSGNSSIVTPRRVVGLRFEKTTAPSLSTRLQWERIPSNEAHGYYVYRAKSLHSKKVNIAVIPDNNTNNYEDYEGLVENEQFFYWVSAYIEYPPHGRLEGRLSDHVEVRF